MTAVHVAKAVEIVDREALILDVREGASDENGEWICDRLSTSLSYLALDFRLSMANR